MQGSGHGRGVATDGHCSSRVKDTKWPDEAIQGGYPTVPGFSQ